MANLYAKNFSDADEVKNPPKAKVEVVKLGNVNASKLVLQPGWVCQNVLNQQLRKKLSGWTCWCRNIWEIRMFSR